MHHAPYISALITSLCLTLMACRTPEPTPQDTSDPGQTFQAALAIFCEPLSDVLLDTPEEAFTQAILEHWQARISSQEVLALIDDLTDPDHSDPIGALDEAIARAGLKACPVRAQLFEEDRSTEPGALLATAEEMRDALRQVVQTNLPAIQRCHRDELRINPSFDGRLKLGLTINAVGAVSEVSVEYNEQVSPSDAFTECLYNEVFRWTFPRPPSAPMKVLYPLNFTS